MMSRLVVDFGHGVGQDRGAIGFISEESVIDAVGPLVVKGLRNIGDTVLEVRPARAGSVGISLNQRINSSDAFGADLFISIHANAASGEGHGVEVWTMNEKRLPEAVNVCNKIAALGISNRGIKDGSHLAVVKNTIASAMLVEICFIDNADDVAWFNRVGAQAIADAIVSGITGTSITTTSAPVGVTLAVSTVENAEARYWVGRVQQVCNANGSNIKVDSYWGDITKGAVGQIPLSGRAYKNIEATNFIQERLGLTVDGMFWILTDMAVREWQKSHSLIEDGVVGYYTYRSLALQD
jgi:N-acetylmuramoyl-L-alanine amidase